MSSGLALTVLKFAAAASVFPAVHAVFALPRAPVSAQIERAYPPAVLQAADMRHQIPISGDGLYYIDAELKGRTVHFMVDSGANTTILTQADARRVGLHPERMYFRRTIVTANGEAPLATVEVASIEIAGKSYRQVPVSVIGNPGGVSLLGQDMIARLDGVSISDGVMTLAG